MKSIIDYSHYKAESYDEKNAFLEKLVEIEDISEWSDVDSKNIVFSDNPNANPFQTMGGDEFEGVLCSFDGGNNFVPWRYTALPSVLNRCEIYGNGMERLFLANKRLFSDTLNRTLELVPTNKRKMKALVQDGKLSALHSGRYARISQLEIFEIVQDYLDEFEYNTFINANWSWEQTRATYEIEEPKLFDTYNKLLGKYFGSRGRTATVLLTVVTSDVCESAVQFRPSITIDTYKLPLTGIASVKHIGNVSMETVEKKLYSVFASFEAACRSLAALADIKVINKKNVMIKAFADIKFPQKYAADICEKNENHPATALDCYVAMTEALNVVANFSSVDASAMLVLEEALTKVILYSAKKWSSFDIPGTVSWGAKSRTMK